MKKPKLKRFFIFTLLFFALVLAAGQMFGHPMALLFSIPGITQRWVITVPSRCEDVHGFLSHAPPALKQRVLSEVLPLVAMTPEALTVKAHEFDLITNSLRWSFNGGSFADSATIDSCLQSLVRHMDRQSVQLLGLLLQRFEGIEKLRYAGGGKWYGALVDSCRMNDTCAKEVAKKYTATHSGNERDEWLVLLGQLNEYGAGEMMPILENLPGLGLSRHDTNQEVDEQADQLAKVVLQKLLANETEYTKYLKDQRRPLAVRWRVAKVRADLQSLEDLPPDLIREAFASDKMSVEEKFDTLARYPKLADSLPDYIKDFSQTGQMLLENPQLDEVDKTQMIKNLARVLDYLRQHAPTALPSDNRRAAADDLAILTSHILKSCTSNEGESPKLFRLVARAALEHPLVAQPLPAIAELLQNRQTFERGLLLLSIKETPGPWVYRSIAAAMLNISGSDRAAFVNRLLEQSSESEFNRRLLAAAFPYMTESEHKLVRASQGRQIERFFATLASLSEDPALGMPAKIALQASLTTFSFKGKKPANYVYELNRKFTCSEDWITTAQAFTLLGPKTPGFEAAIFKLLSCPPEQVNYSFMDKALLDKTARHRIQDFLSASRGIQPTQTQLQRLTDILSHANRIPGSTLPPKIKHEN